MTWDQQYDCDSMALLECFLNSLKDPFVFVDTTHCIRYMNQPALDHYKEGDSLLGTSIFDCHNEESNQMMRDIFQEMLDDGIDERLITDNEKWRIYMRAVRTPEGELLGYFERYEPPRVAATGGHN